MLKNLAAKLRRARSAVELAVIESDDLPTRIEEAYTTALDSVDQVSAWKIGGASTWSRAALGADHIFFGPLTAFEVFKETKTLEISHLFKPLCEPEVMLEIGDPDAEDPIGQFTRFALGFEIPASVLPDWAKESLVGQVADRAGAGALWIGPSRALDPNLLTAHFDGEFCLNREEHYSANSEGLIGGPLGVAQDFLDLAKKQSIQVEAGQWIATGGLVPAVCVKPGDQVLFTALSDAVSVRFVCRR